MYIQTLFIRHMLNKCVQVINSIKFNRVFSILYIYIYYIYINIILNLMLTYSQGENFQLDF